MTRKLSRNLCLATLGVLIAFVGVALFWGGRASAAPGSVFTVNSADDSDDGTCNATHCSLREAINAANANVGTDKIAFSILGSGPHTIQPLSALPAITDAALIDGYTQPEAKPNKDPLRCNPALKIELDGSSAGLVVGGLVFNTGGQSTVRGLAINRFNGNGIVFGGSWVGPNTVKGNLIGTDLSGTLDMGNRGSGVSIWGGTSHITIGGTAVQACNVISGNDTHGIAIEFDSAGENMIQGNFIGTDVTGAADLGNSGDGVHIQEASGNTIGGTTARAGNVVSGNDARGVVIAGSGATGNLVQGNLIGADETGATDVGNSGDGVHIWEASGNTIGGMTAGAGNVVSGNDASGVVIAGSGATANVVQGNFIGTDATGATYLGNSWDGVHVQEASANIIGGTTAGAGNVVSGNGASGVVIAGSGATANVVQGNLVGTDVSGSVALANLLDGLVLYGGASDSMIGGTMTGARNVVSGNRGNGVRVEASPLLPAIRNTIWGNSIHSNGYMGIDNVNAGNLELAPPIIDSVGGSVSGHTSPKCYPCTVELFSDGEDEGRVYHGSTTTNDDLTGTWAYAGTVIGPNVTATVTDSAGNTSEFSAPLAPCIDRLGDTACDDPVNDPDDDGCTAAEEAALGSVFDSTADGWYDVYDVPVPAKADADGANGIRDQVVDIRDVLAVLLYAFAQEDGPPNVNGVDYDAVKGVDLDGDTDNDIPPLLHPIKEGLKYDRSPGLGPDPVTGIDPAGLPDGVIDIRDVLAALAQFGLDCSGPP